MTRVRLRDARPDGEAERRFYAERYPSGYAHDAWPDHVERVAASVEMLRRWQAQFRTAADLSCGDGAVLHGLASGLDRAWLGDLNAVRTGRRPWTGIDVNVLTPAALPDSLVLLPEPVDLFVLSETLEHMDDPDDILRRIGDVARYLFVSTPLNEAADSGNQEHYWSWDQDDVHRMLEAAGWSPLELELLRPVSTRDLPGAYTYQLWLAVRR